MLLAGDAGKLFSLDDDRLGLAKGSCRDEVEDSVRSLVSSSATKSAKLEVVSLGAIVLASLGLEGRGGIAFDALGSSPVGPLCDDSLVCVLDRRDEEPSLPSLVLALRLLSACFLLRATRSLWQGMQ